MLLIFNFVAIKLEAKMDTLHRASEILRRFGIRPSHQRMAVMEYLIKHPSHNTAEEVYEGLLPEIPTLSKTTIHNTLHLFKDSGAVRALNIGAEPIRFDSVTEPHAHFYCNVCHQIHDVKIDKDLWHQVRRIMPDKAEELQILFKGVCSECS